MKDIIVLDGDILQFDLLFGHRQVTVTGVATIKGTGHATVQKRKICIKGDETRVRIPAIYQIAGYSPGQGMLTIKTLMANQQAPRCTTKKAMLLKGQKFIAEFTPTVPAVMTSPPSTPDPTSPTTGFGSFITRQIVAYAE